MRQERYKTQRATQTRSFEEVETSQTGLERIGFEKDSVEKEEKNLAEGWIFKYPITSVDWIPGIKDIWLEWSMPKR